jgi:hypothetical protein
VIGEAGYSHRVSPDPADDQSRPTGSLTYVNQLTGKTLVQTTVSRDIQSYFVDAGSQLETAATAKVVWLPTYRIAVSTSYSWILHDLPDQGNLPDTTRVDHLQQLIIKLEYQPLDWLWVEMYGNLQTRRSNVQIGDFSSDVVGVNFNVHWHCLPAVGFGTTLLSGYRPCPG